MLVTLTTDFGDRDWYVGALKGAVLRQQPQAQVVDVSHHIAPFDIVQAALVLRNVWPEFPEGTVHLLAVNCVYAPDFRFVAVRHAGHFFVAPDNGVLTLLFGEIAQSDVRYLPSDPATHFAVKGAFAQAVGHLGSGGDFDTLGDPAAEPLLQRIGLQPVITPTRIRGTVVHIDHFDNAVLNIHRDLFEQVRAGRAFSLFFKRNDPLTQLSTNYCDVPLGEPLCLFNSAGFLEIAVNLGRAATLLGLRVEDVVEITFE